MIDTKILENAYVDWKSGTLIKTDTPRVVGRELTEDEDKAFKSALRKSVRVVGDENPVTTFSADYGLGYDNETGELVSWSPKKA